MSLIFEKKVVVNNLLNIQLPLPITKTAVICNDVKHTCLFKTYRKKIFLEILRNDVELEESACHAPLSHFAVILLHLSTF